MDRQEQIDFILDHYENPRHYGPMAEPTVVQKGGNPGCGDIVTFYLRLDGEDRIADISFEGEGCTISQAGASLVAERFHGKPVAVLKDTPVDEILDELGRELAATRLKCAALGINTAKEAVRQARPVR